MISTYFALDQLASPQAFFAALVVGLAFGFVLERAGFGSSRRLAGIFYFRDMTVLRVMFTALIFGMLGLLAFESLGLIESDQVYRMKSIYGAQAVGGGEVQGVDDADPERRGHLSAASRRRGDRARFLLPRAGRHRARGSVAGGSSERGTFPRLHGPQSNPHLYEGC